jgi:hypothetical protein
MAKRHCGELKTLDTRHLDPKRITRVDLDKLAPWLAYGPVTRCVLADDAFLSVGMAAVLSLITDQDPEGASHASRADQGTPRAAHRPGSARGR